MIELQSSGLDYARLHPAGRDVRRLGDELLPNVAASVDPARCKDWKSDATIKSI
ncbi:MAG: hypothetical protein J5W83_11005 [Candidatus Accumulibacter sp.]|uniref:hypothetical protein n=1 Tax=Accumulibacter sp. TaxID=2053492 RepID=UPI001B059A14|nr:hypothetical protein [Accumulibacter sp.]MBO3703051.1 hypothetical protein [Accumulibacter sp.]